MDKMNLAILIFNDVEVLDFTGPFEVFSSLNEINDYSLLNIYTVGISRDIIIARNGLKVTPDYGINECPSPDILVIPGGFGTRALLNDDSVIKWIIEKAESSEKVFSVCSGALLLGKANLLKGLKATTHHEVLNDLKEIAKDCEVLENERFIDNGKIITSAGVTAGIDASFHLSEILFGKEKALETSKYIEYIHYT